MLTNRVSSGIIIQANFCGHGPLVKRLRQRPLTPLTWVRFPHGSAKKPLQLMLECFSCYPERGMEQGPCARSAQKTVQWTVFLARGRFPRVSPETLQLMLECFSCIPSEESNRAVRRSAPKQSSGLFFSPRREIPACVSQKHSSLCWSVFSCIPCKGYEPDGAQVLLCAIMERCVFGCILDMKIPPELSAFFLCLL